MFSLQECCSRLPSRVLAKILRHHLGKEKIRNPETILLILRILKERYFNGEDD